MSTNRKGVQEPGAELQDLEVREVSLVDRPANKLPWYIVKRCAEGLLNITIKKEKGMATMAERIRAALGDEVVEVTDLLDLTTEKDDGLDDTTTNRRVNVEKASKAEALAAAEAVVGKLMPVANAVKSAALTPDTAATLKEIAGELRDLAKSIGEAEDTEDTEEKAAAEKVADALSRLMKVVNVLKSEGEEIPGDMPKEIKAIAAMLMAAAAQAANAEDAKEGDGEGENKDDGEGNNTEGNNTEETNLRAFVVGKGEDPEVILVRAAKGASADEVLAQVFKAGAKIKRARLSKLVEAYKILAVILTEVGALEPKTKTTKAVVPPVVAAPSPELMAMLKAQQDSLAGVTTALTDIGQRVKAMEVGEGTPEGDGEPIKKKEGGFWGGKIVPTR